MFYIALDKHIHDQYHLQIILGKNRIRSDYNPNVITQQIESSC
jgi:hypothetical protein